MMCRNLQLKVRCLGVLTVMVAVLLLPTGSSGHEGVMLRKVLVSRAKVTTSLTRYHYKLPSGANQNTVCSSKSLILHWSAAWCWDPSTQECIFVNTILTIGYQEPDMTDAITCYTRRTHHDFVTFAESISAGPQHHAQPLMVKENLLDGFYNHAAPTECYASKVDDKKYQWLMIDLGSPKTFSHVMVKAESGSWAREFQQVEVRVGISAVPESWDGLDGLDFFDYFAGEATSDQEVLFEVPVPITARYVSVRKMVDTQYLMVCHVEVY